MSEKTIISIGPYSLCHCSKNWPLFFCWFLDGGDGYKAAFRNDPLIYIAGFRTRDEAEEWAQKEGILEKEKAE